MDGTFWMMFGLLMAVLGSSWRGGGGKSDQRLRRLERKMDLILKHLGIDASEGVNPEVLELVKAGQKIQAIKVYREQTGVGLKEAKEYVERL